MDDHMAQSIVEQLDIIAMSISEPKLRTPRVYMHRAKDVWCAEHGSIVGYGKSPNMAYEAYITEWHTCIDTTCRSYRCPKCTKAHQTEGALEAEDGT